MENAVDALKIAFAMFVLVLAITITFSVASQARSTADYVMYYADKTNFYENLDSKENNRTVSVAEVISTLNSYIDNSISVTVIFEGNEYVFDSGRETVVDEDGNISEKVKLNSTELKKQNLQNFIENKLLNSSYEFEENFTNISIGRNIRLR